MISQKNNLIKIISGLSTLHEKTALFFNKYNLEPISDSRAISELTAFRTESVQTAYSQGNMLIESSADQLCALNKSLTEPVLTVAPFISARANLESSALAAWLLDTTIDAKERVQRSLSFRFEGLYQQVKFAQAAGLDTKAAMKRIDDVEKLALSLGFPPIRDRKGKRIGIGQQFPKMTDLIGSVLNEESNYRLLSAFAHAHSWAIQQLSFIPSQIHNNNNKSNFSSNTKFFEKALKPEAIIFLCHKTAYVFTRPVWNKAALYGYSLLDLKKILNEAFDDLRFSRADRFWDTI